MKRLASGTNWTETKEREESPATHFNYCCYYRCFLFLTVSISSLFLIPQKWRRRTREPILCQQKCFWSASEALLSNGHQWTLIYDFLVNIAVHSNKSGTQHLPGNVHYFSQILFLELVKELCQCSHETARCSFLQQKIWSSLQITFKLLFSDVWHGLDFKCTTQELLDVVVLVVQRKIRLKLLAFLNLLFNGQSQGSLQILSRSRQERLPFLVPLPGLLLAQRRIALAYRGVSYENRATAPSGTGSQGLGTRLQRLAGQPLEAGWWEGCISPLTLGMSYLFLHGNLTFPFQALLEGLFHVLSLLIKPHSCHLSPEQFFPVMTYSFRIK